MICHCSAKIGPKEILKNIEGSLGDIDLMLIDNASSKILLVEIKNYNECKTPWEAVDNETKLLSDMKKVVKRDDWARANKTLFGYYARKSTADFMIASVMLTYNMCGMQMLHEEFKTDIPIVWMRDVIEDPMKIFDYGIYS